MKTKLAVLACSVLLSLSMLFGTSAVFASQVDVGNRKDVNVMSSLTQESFGVTDMQGNKLSCVTHGGFFDENSFDYTLDCLNDGFRTSWSAICPANDDGDAVQGWFTVDFGKVIPVHTIMMTMQHDWLGTDVVIQLACDKNYSDAVTIYNNDIDNSLGLGNVFSADKSIEINQYLNNYGTAGQTTENNGNYFRFAPVAARYMRVTNNQYGDAMLQGYTAVGELEVYSYESVVNPTRPSEVPVVAATLPEGEYDSDISTEFVCSAENAEIYYTSDGSVPTENSLKYTQPIICERGHSAMLRACAVVNGICGIPETFNYSVKKSELIGKNIALNKPIKLMSYDMTRDISDTVVAANKPDEAGASDVKHINDDSFDIWYMQLTNELSWAVIDFEDEYFIDYVMYDAYWDWWMGDNVVEIATLPDFSDGKVVWSEINNIQTNHGYKIPVQARGRYLRVTNNKERAGQYSAFTEIQAFVGDELMAGIMPEGSNAAQKKDIAVKSYDLSKDLTDSLWAFNKADESGANTADHINDAEFNMWYAEMTAEKAWAIIDFGSEQYIDHIVYCSYHDWGVGENLIQLAIKADFSDAVTVYDHPEAIVTGQTGVEADAKVYARYMRVTNYIDNHVGKGSVFTEIQAIAGKRPTVEISEQEYVKKVVSDDLNDVNCGTAEADIVKPDHVTVTLSDGTERTVDVTWNDFEGYNSAQTGIYSTHIANHGEVNDPFGLMNKIVLTVEVIRNKSLLELSIAPRFFAGAEEVIYTVTAKSEYTVKFYKGNEELVDKPTERGEYRIVVTIDESDIEEGAVVEKSFVIIDKRVLEQKLADIAALDSKKYSEKSWNAMQEKVDVAISVKDNDESTQAAIDLAVADLEFACDNLEKLGDKTALSAKYNEVKDIENIYTKATWSVFEEKLTDAKELLDKAEVYEKELTNALNALESAYNDLVKKCDFGNLESAVNDALKIDTTKYISSSGEAFIQALDNAREILKNDESLQEVIDRACNALIEKQEALIEKGDKIELSELLESLNYTGDRYTATSFNAYIVEKEKAEAVKANDDATQQEIDEAKAELQNKIDSLKVIADKTVLFDAIREAEKLDMGIYSKESADAFEEAVKYAQSVADSNDVEQAAADEAVTILNTARKNLKEETAELGCGSSVAGAKLPLAGIFIAACLILFKRKRR